MRITACLLLFALTPAATAVQPPDYLTGPAREQFERFRDSERHRAFALGPGGAWGLSYNHQDVEAARRAALGFCREYVADCVVIAENDHVLEQTHPFPRTGKRDAKPGWYHKVSAATADTLAVLGLVVLVIGTLAAERHPMMVKRPARGPGDRRAMQVNYAYVIVATIYFIALMPTFARNLPADAGSFMAWLRFGLPIVPPALATLYLQARGALGRPPSQGANDQ